MPRVINLNNILGVKTPLGIFYAGVTKKPAAYGVFICGRLFVSCISLNRYNAIIAFSNDSNPSANSL